MSCLVRNPTTFLSIDWPFGPFAPLNSLIALLDCSIRWPGVAYSPLSHIKAVCEVSICTRACSKSTFFLGGGSLTRGGGMLF